MLGSWVSWIITSVLKFYMFRYCANCMYLPFRKFVPIWTRWNQIGMKWALASPDIHWQRFLWPVFLQPRWGDIKPRRSLGRNVAFLFTHSGYEKKKELLEEMLTLILIWLFLPQAVLDIYISANEQRKKPWIPSTGRQWSGRELTMLGS